MRNRRYNEEIGIALREDPVSHAVSIAVVAVVIVMAAWIAHKVISYQPPQLEVTAQPVPAKTVKPVAPTKVAQR